MATNLITLLTDFGLRDPFVGVMKGVIHAVAPEARIVDVSHDVAPQDVDEGGLWWSRAVPFFPAGAVHVGIVDPGVGSEREIVAARARVSPRCFTAAAGAGDVGSAGESIFLAPDNGILGHVIEERDLLDAVFVRAEAYRLPVVSSTFHGRDVFAPVAAHLARGLALEELGPPAAGLELGPAPERRSDAPGGGVERIISGEIRAVDRFGNCSTDVALNPAEIEQVVDVRVGGRSFGPVRRFYGQVAPGEAIVVVDSWGCLEIAVNRGNAAEELGVGRATDVLVRLRNTESVQVPTARGQENSSRRRNSNESTGLGDGQ